MDVSCDARAPRRFPRRRRAALVEAARSRVAPQLLGLFRCPCRVGQRAIEAARGRPVWLLRRRAPQPVRHRLGLPSRVGRRDRLGEACFGRRSVPTAGPRHRRAGGRARCGDRCRRQRAPRVFSSVTSAVLSCCAAVGPRTNWAGPGSCKAAAGEITTRSSTIMSSCDVRRRGRCHS
jgi:hypothetical protein